MRGRKPRPTYMQLVEGNPGKRRVNTKQPMPAGDLRHAPDWFTPSQCDIWEYAITHAPPRLLKKLDLSAMQVWVIACDLHQQASALLARYDADKTAKLLTKNAKGNIVPNPYVGIINKQALIMLKAAAELGFTPSSRSRIELEDGDENPQDAAAKYF